MKFLGGYRGMWSLALVLGMLFSGCAKVGPDYARPPASVSSSWMEAGDRRIDGGPARYCAWWEAFDDPALNRIIDTAYRENLSLQIAGVRVLEARAQLGIAVGDLYPQLQRAEGSVLFNRISERSVSASQGQTGPASGARNGASAPGFDSSYRTDQINLNAAWEIDFWGRFRRAVESADAALRMSVADYDSALVSLTADAAGYYIQARTIEKRLAIARQNVRTQRESLWLAQTRFEGGLTSERDVEQARTILYNTLAAVPGLEIESRQARDALCVLLAMAPNDLQELMEGPSDIPAPPPQVAVGIPADLLRRRPDVRSAELRAAAQCGQIGVAKADLYPAFSLVGTFGFSASDIGTFHLSDMFGWKARQGSIGPSFQWNILNYGQITNNVRVQDARFQELLLAYRNTVLQAQQQVEDSLAGFLRSQERAELLAESASAAQRSLDLAFIQYRQGSTDFTTVLTAQQALLTAQDSLAGAMGDISGNLVGVYRALGGGWEIRRGQDLVSPEVREAMAKRTNWGNLLSPAAYMPCPAEPGRTVRPPDW